MELLEKTLVLNLIADYVFENHEQLQKNMHSIQSAYLDLADKVAAQPFMMKHTAGVNDRRSYVEGSVSGPKMKVFMGLEIDYDEDMLTNDQAMMNSIKYAVKKLSNQIEALRSNQSHMENINLSTSIQSLEPKPRPVLPRQC